MFAGQDAGGHKGLAELGGQSMLAHIIARFRPQVQHLVLNANGEPARFSHFGLEVVADAPHCAARGPLAGLVTAMQWAECSARTFDAVATVTTDCPFIPRDLVAQLAARFDEAPLLAASGGDRHPAIGLWPMSAAGAVKAAAESGDWSLGRLATRLNGLAVDFPLSKVGALTADPFFNANTPDDLAAARTLLRHMT